MSVPFIDLSRVVREVRDEVLADWAACLDETAFVGGARVDALEAELADALGCRAAVACSNGSDAIVLALAVRGVGPGHRVATSDLTFWATYEAIVQVGARPVLFDVDEDLHLDLDALFEAHRAAPLDAVVLPQLFGWCAPRTVALRDWCRAEGVALIEDSAQAFGVALKGGASVLAGAPLATLSFYPAKVLGGASDGGAIVTDDPEVAARLRVLRNHGRADHYRFAEVGWNARMSGPNAAYLSRMLARRDAIVGQRRRALDRYAERLAVDPRVRLHRGPAGVTGNGYLAVVTVEGWTGDALADGLRARGIGCARTYPETLSQQAPARDAERAMDPARARAFCRDVVNLPLFYGIADDEVDRSAGALLELVAGG